jgi:hypothetical protein
MGSCAELVLGKCGWSSQLCTSEDCDVDKIDIQIIDFVVPEGVDNSEDVFGKTTDCRIVLERRVRPLLGMWGFDMEFIRWMKANRPNLDDDPTPDISFDDQGPLGLDTSCLLIVLRKCAPVRLRSRGVISLMLQNCISIIRTFIVCRNQSHSFFVLQLRIVDTLSAVTKTASPMRCWSRRRLQDRLGFGD